MSVASSHAKFGLLALLPLLVYFSYSIATREIENGSVDVGIEHTQPVTVSFTVAKRGTIRLIEVAHSGSETIKLSVPSHWRRTEVRGVPLSALTSDDASFGFVRWHLPAGAVVSFRTDEPFGSLTVHNPTNVPLTARLTSIDLALGSSSLDAKLLQNSSVVLPLDELPDTP